MLKKGPYEYIANETLPELEGVFKDVLKALSNEDRIRFLKIIISGGPITPTDLKQDHNFFLEQCTITHHLTMLKRAGIVMNDGKQGRNILYRVNKVFLQNFILDLFSYIGVKLKVEMPRVTGLSPRLTGGIVPVEQMHLFA